MDLDLKGRVAIVTGASRGIGKAAALSLAREGARVVVTYHRDRERAEAVVDQIHGQGGEARAVELDLASPETIQSAVATALERWDRVDILVNNAVEWGKRLPFDIPPFEEIPIPEWRELLRSNIEGAYVAIQ